MLEKKEIPTKTEISIKTEISTKVEFKKITFEELPIIKEYLRENKNRACDFTIGNNILWNQDNRVKYAIIDNMVVYAIEKEDSVTFFMPDMASEECLLSEEKEHSEITEFTLDTMITYQFNEEKLQDYKKLIEKLSAFAQKCNKKLRLAVVSESQKEMLQKFWPEKFLFSFDRDESDYIYKVEDLKNFSGKKYHGKKNHINKFKKTYEYEYEELNEGNIAECRAMKEKWGETKVSDDAESLRTELRVVDVALNHYQQFGFRGALIRIDGEVKAFTLGEAVTQDTFVTHVEKAFDDVNGLYTMMCHEFAKNTIGDFVYVNREEDLGIEGLRKSKLSYQPAMLWNKYVAVEK